MGNNKQHIYLMPGLGANSLIFEYLQFPKDKYCVHLLDWLMPIKNESLNYYCIRFLNEIKHENIILIGVSFVNCKYSHINELAPKPGIK